MQNASPGAHGKSSKHTSAASPQCVYASSYGHRKSFKHTSATSPLHSHSSPQCVAYRQGKSSKHTQATQVHCAHAWRYDQGKSSEDTSATSPQHVNLRYLGTSTAMPQAVHRQRAPHLDNPSSVRPCSPHKCVLTLHTCVKQSHACKPLNSQFIRST
jgi:hypothetical protein